VAVHPLFLKGVISFSHFSSKPCILSKIKWSCHRTSLLVIFSISDKVACSDDFLLLSEHTRKETDVIILRTVLINFIQISQFTIFKHIVRLTELKIYRNQTVVLRER